MKRSRITLVVACVALVGALLVGVWAVLAARPDAGTSEPSAGGTSTATASPTATTTAKPGQPGKDPEGNVTAFAVPRGTVDPTRGRSYCSTVRLLAIYSQQGYGLSKSQAVVDGRKFQTRLTVIAATYDRLADQSADNPRAGAVARHWRAMAAVAVATEEKLRVNGLQVQSQSMIVQLARLAQTSHAELPKAVATLPAACGYAPAVLGL